MIDQQDTLAFANIPNEYISSKDNICNEDLKQLYSQFQFLCFHQNEQKDSETFLTNFLKKHKFITYKNTSQEKDFVDSTLCMEDYCLIIKSINIISLIQILKKTNAVILDLNSPDKKYDEIRQEISSFINYFLNDIKNNELINLTINPIAAYIIRRHFHPSNYFKNISFFKFSNDQNTNIKETFDYSELNPQKILNKIEKDKKKIDGKKHFYEFVKSNFILLRTIYKNSYASFYLVIHIKSFKIFMMKTINNSSNEKSVSHEKDFCNSYSHRCLTQFYGFVKKDKKIIGFIYEYMCNGNLYYYLTENKGNINDAFLYMTMIRIAQGIKYLHSNSLIHRDIKSFNILINHDHIPFLSDFDSIRKIDESTSEMTHDLGSLHYISPEQHQFQKYSFPTDIYSFGQLIYFLYEKKDYLENTSHITIIDDIKNIQLPVDNHIPKSFQNIFNNCVIYDESKRPTINSILNDIKNDASSFSFLELNYLKNIINILHKPQIQQFFKEMYHLLFISSDISQDYIQNHLFQVYQIINIMKKQEISNIFYLIGKCYNDGEIVEQNYIKAEEYFEISANMNNLDAIFSIGSLHDTDDESLQDYQKAIECYRKCAQQNHLNAINNLGRMYRFGLGVSQDYKKAKEYFELAAKQNNKFAFNNLGMMYYYGQGVKKNFEKSKFFLELAAKQNHPEALNALAVFYYHGQGVEKDIEMALKYFEAAANLNFPLAMINLGDMYLKGDGVEKDYHKAKKYYELAANKCASSHYNLGIIYKKGLIDAIDYLNAKKHFEIASKADHPLALYQLGKLYYFGKGLEQDFNKAREYFERSSKLKCGKAYFYLGIMYKNGQGIAKNYNESIKYFELADFHNNSKALFQIAVFHFNGLLDNYDYKKAREYFEISAKKQDFNSTYYLGLIYEKGLSVKRDILKAINYYEKCSINKSSKFVLLSNNDEESIYEEKIFYNQYYYQSNNDLGLIYITEKEHINREMAEKYLNEAGLNEYPPG